MIHGKYCSCAGCMADSHERALVDDAFRPGWFARAAAQVLEETKDWPEWEKHYDIQRMR